MLSPAVFRHQFASRRCRKQKKGRQDIRPAGLVRIANRKKYYPERSRISRHCRLAILVRDNFLFVIISSFALVSSLLSLHPAVIVPCVITSFVRLDRSWPFQPERCHPCISLHRYLISSSAGIGCSGWTWSSAGFAAFFSCLRCFFSSFFFCFAISLCRF